LHGCKQHFRGLKGLTIHPFAPDSLAWVISVAWPSVVNISTGMLVSALLLQAHEKIETIHPRHVDVADDHRQPSQRAIFSTASTPSKASSTS